MKLSRSFPLLAALLVLPVSSSGCAKSCGSGSEVDVPSAPPAPPMPPGWTVKKDVEIPRDKFWEVENRLKGKLKALRNTIYEVNGQRVQLNVIVPLNAVEADKIFRILANMKASWSYVRKGELIYEFVGKNESAEEIKKARKTLE